MIDFKIVLTTDDAKIPTKNDGDNGWDLYCCPDENFSLGYIDKKLGFELDPYSRYIFSTGIKIGFPSGYYGIIKDRSGWAVNSGITTLAGLIDTSFTGVIKVCLYNTSSSKVVIFPGDRIAQLTIHKNYNMQFEVVDSLEETSRGESGFGSSGN